MKKIKLFIINKLTVASIIIAISFIVYSFIMFVFDTQGIVLMTCKGTSMLPALPYQAVTFNKKLNVNDINNIKVGDIVVYLDTNDNLLINHRVIGINDDNNNITSFTVKGDFNNTPDAPVLPSQIQYKLLFHIPYYFNFLLNEEFNVKFSMAASISFLWLVIALFKNELIAKIKNRRLKKNQLVSTL